MAPTQMKGTIESAEQKAKAAVMGLDKEKVRALQCRLVCGCVCG